MFRPSGVLRTALRTTFALSDQKHVAKSHRAAAEQHGKGDHVKGMEHSKSVQQHPQGANKNGAALDVATPVGIPATFTLAIPSDGLHFRLPRALAESRIGFKFI
jgi:hypothetical protein